MEKKSPLFSRKFPRWTGTGVKVLILLVWAGLMGLLAERNLFQPQALKVTPALARDALKTGEEWWGVYWKGEKIGFAVTEQDLRQERIQVRERLWLKMALLGLPQTIEQALDYTLTEKLTLESFDFQLQSGLFPFRISGWVQDSPQDSRKRLLLKVRSGGREQEQQVVLTEAPFILGQTKLHFLTEGLEAGKKYRIPIFDPTTLSSAEMIAEVEDLERLTIRGEERKLFRVRQEYRGLSVKSWIDPNGHTWKEESPVGLVLVRESQSEARFQNWSSGKLADLLALTAVPSDREIPNPRSLSYLRVKLHSGGLTGLKVEGDRQTRVGDEVIIEKEDVPPPVPEKQPLPDGEKEAALRSTPFIQSDHPEVRGQAMAIVGGSSDPVERVRKLTAWVYREVRKQPVMSVPSALEVLRQRVGDCNEHAVLFVALARALGIPARQQAGIIYQEGKFFYHAWAQVYVGAWLTADPSLNQVPADAAHIRLVEGDLDRQADLVKVIGRLRVEVKEFR
ncbi:MAG: transglutaminase domain-containing protein [Syntrophaceae bacterium]|nr:transglutaminase domain-containing protein [Syntrophaceae bacterium]